MLFEADILLGNPKPVELVAKATNLKWIQFTLLVLNITVILKYQLYYQYAGLLFDKPCAETA
jgi:hypothetical protein